MPTVYEFMLCDSPQWMTMAWPGYLLNSPHLSRGKNAPTAHRHVKLVSLLNHEKDTETVLGSPLPSVLFVSPKLIKFPAVCLSPEPVQGWLQWVNLYAKRRLQYYGHVVLASHVSLAVRRRSASVECLPFSLHDNQLRPGIDADLTILTVYIPVPAKGMLFVSPVGKQSRTWPGK